MSEEQASETPLDDRYVYDTPAYTAYVRETREQYWEMAKSVSRFSDTWSRKLGVYALEMSRLYAAAVEATPRGDDRDYYEERYDTWLRRATQHLAVYRALKGE